MISHRKSYKNAAAKSAAPILTAREVLISEAWQNAGTRPRGLGFQTVPLPPIAADSPLGYFEAWVPDHLRNVGLRHMISNRPTEIPES